MKIYTFGAEDAPVLLLLPGTCCHWKSNFGAVIPLLADSFRVLCVSYDGFDETEQTEFPTMLEETKKIELYLKNHCGGHIRAAYGCSLGGSFVGLLAARQNIHMDYGILGSSDLDQASPLAASLQTDFLLPLIYPVVRDGKFKAKFLQKRLDKRARESGDYVKAFLKMFGDARPYVTMQSCKNQFYSDLITPLPDNIHVKLTGTVLNDKVYQIYSTEPFHVFVNVSKSEGVPVSIMEAMSFSIPVVATSVGGTAELVDEGKNGFLLDENFRTEELVALLYRFYKMPEEEYVRYRMDARSKFKAQYDAEHNYAEFVKGLAEKTGKKI